MGRKWKLMNTVASLSLAVTVMGVGGCASSGDRNRTAGQYEQDQRLAGNVKDALSAAPVYKYPDVTVNAYRGKVQLSGFVTTEAQKEAADRIASGIPGVEQVENNLLLKQSPAGSALGGGTSPGGSSQE